MNKYLSAVVMLALCSVLLTACGNGSTGKSETSAESTSASEETTLPSETEISTEGPTAEITETTTAAAEEEVTETTTTANTEETETETSVTEETSVTQETTAVQTVTVTEKPEETAAEEEIVADENDPSENEKTASEYASMDDFLSADIFSIDGKATAAKNCPSYGMISELTGSDKFRCEISAFDGSFSVVYAVSGDKALVEGNFNPESKEKLKYIVRDSRLYMFNDEAKLAMYIPADKTALEIASAESILSSIQIDAKAGTNVVSDVKIAGKSYKLECGESAAMLFNSDGSLYAVVTSVNSLELSLYKFTVAKDIPSGTFDIPKGCTEVDLEAAMAESEE